MTSGTRIEGVELANHHALSSIIMNQISPRSEAHHDFYGVYEFIAEYHRLICINHLFNIG